MSQFNKPIDQLTFRPLAKVLTAPELRFFASLRITFSRRFSVILSEAKNLGASNKEFCKRSFLSLILYGLPGGLNAPVENFGLAVGDWVHFKHTERLRCCVNRAPETPSPIGVGNNRG